MIYDAPEKPLDPLLTAVFAKLPRHSTEWAAEDRAKWINLLSAALNVVYGPYIPDINDCSDDRKA